MTGDASADPAGPQDPSSHRRLKILGVILAGGAGSRMGGADKGALPFAGARLIDHVAERLFAQADHLMIAGRHDYGLGVPCAPDRPEGLRGPAAALYSALCWMEEHECAFDGIVTAPADGPFLPADLAARLASADHSAVASDGETTHPTFAWWRRADLERLFAAVTPDDAPSLRRLCEDANARSIGFADAAAFFNVNTPDDLERAEALLVRPLPRPI